MTKEQQKARIEALMQIRGLVSSLRDHYERIMSVCDDIGKEEMANIYLEKISVCSNFEALIDNSIGAINASNSDIAE